MDFFFNVFSLLNKKMFEYRICILMFLFMLFQRILQKNNLIMSYKLTRSICANYTCYNCLIKVLFTFGQVVLPYQGHERFD